MFRIGKLDANSRIDKCFDLMDMIRRACDQPVYEATAGGSSMVIRRGVDFQGLKK
ncbi:MAG: hypothetical protein FJY85_14050 [Deltaproteobacteria bacterium]|nr:hypothetical protein [Deltaproteobacteria bacterium]